MISSSLRTFSAFLCLHNSFVAVINKIQLDKIKLKFGRGVISCLAMQVRVPCSSDDGRCFPIGQSTILLPLPCLETSFLHISFLCLIFTTTVLQSLGSGSRASLCHHLILFICKWSATITLLIVTATSSLTVLAIAAEENLQQLRELPGTTRLGRGIN